MVHDAIEVTHDWLAHCATPSFALDDPFLTVVSFYYNVNSVVANCPSTLSLVPQ